MTTVLSDFAIDAGLRSPLRVTYRRMDSDKGSTIDLPYPFAVIGRAAGCHVRILDPCVAERHAYIQVVGGRLYRFVLGMRPAGVRLDNRDGTEGWPVDGTRFRLGAFELEVRCDRPPGHDGSSPADDRSSDVPQLDLISVVNGATHSHDPHRRPLTLIGRHPACHFQILDPRVRSFHVAIVSGSSATWLVNLRSPERVRVNGRPVRWTSITAGDQLELNGVPVDVRWNRHQIEKGCDGPASVSGFGETIALTALPVSDRLSELQQHTLMMAKVFASLQEQLAVQHRQTELLQEIRDAVLNGSSQLDRRRDGDRPAPLTHAPTSQPVPQQAPPDAVPALTDAHQWLLTRLGELGKTT